ncbi:hypothetical protein HGH93_14505 [Chitinophaga polysaccharea]|uniref:hypothetical protein n=1 Tax=Chitinophaga TaxID=79328 RepID=UPI00145558AF|nr:MULTISPECIES: hypothetical protein [Chitinophaga]NLR59324.1 hypothetical protein [Chitinophaga polysaccharea]NLU91908.1 hypothetical protein [Chitinophaga sp. Ak27]
MKSVKIFEYIDYLDCFVVHPAYKTIADQLGLAEWNQVTWIGRYFLCDHEKGALWFDNWELREQLREKASEVGLDAQDLLIIDPEKFKNKTVDPCHTPEERKLFWRDVFRSLELSMELLFSEARKINKAREGHDNFIIDLEQRISALSRRSYVARIF